MNGKHILIVDDEQEIADLLEVYLNSDGYVVHKFYSAEGVLACIREHVISLAVLDVMLPGVEAELGGSGTSGSSVSKEKDGFDLCRRIREEWFFPIIMLTAKIDSVDKITGIHMGADDYITKPFQPLELMARIKAQLRRAELYNPSMAREPGVGIYNPPASGGKAAEIYQVHGLELNVGEHTCFRYGQPVTLTPLEFDILLYLCRHMGQAVSTEELFEQVWGEKYLDSNNTVMTHVAHIREKLQENARKPKWIKTVWGVGYKLEE